MASKNFERAIVLTRINSYTKKLCSKQNSACSQCSFKCMGLCHAILEYSRVASNQITTPDFVKKMNTKEKSNYEDKLWNEVIVAYKGVTA